MKEKKIKHVQAFFRNVRGLTLKNVKDLTGRSQASTSLNENLKVIPARKTILNIAKILGINSKILFYSYGLVPKNIQEMIKSDPFYYMEKLEKLYYNHEKRYGGEDVDLDKLNAARAFEYIVKESKDEKD